MTTHCLSVVLVNAAVRVFLKSVQRAFWSQVKPPPGANLLLSSSIWAYIQSLTLGPLIRDRAKLTLGKGFGIFHYFHSCSREY